MCRCSDNKAAELKKFHDAFFDATRKPEKERLRQEIEKLTFELIRRTLREQGREEALARIEGAIRTNTRPFFLWQLNFSEVFQGKGGFDVVIGNPPYVRHEGIKELKSQLKAEFGPFFRGTADLYTYFYKRGLDILHNQGHLCYIAPNKFMRAAYGANTRTFLTTAVTPRVIIDFGDLPIFDATTYPAILLLKKGRPESKSKIRAATFTEEKEIHKVHKTLTEKGFSMPVAALKQEGWNLEPPEVLALMDKLRAAGTPLGEYVEGRFYRGVLTGFNKAFIIDEKIREQLLAEDPKSEELIKPWVRGRDIKRWRVAWAGLYVIFTRRGVEIERYPAIKRYLERFRGDLEPKKSSNQKRGRKPGPYNWYEIQDNIAYYKEFEHAKIIYPEVSADPRFAIDKNNFFTDKTTFMIPFNEQELPYIIAIASSSLMSFFHKNLGSMMRGRYFMNSKIYIEQLPIVSNANNAKTRLIALVETILPITKSNDYNFDPAKQTKVRQLEAEIDARVAHLYNLTEEEYNLILNKTNTPDPFRVAAQNIYRDIAKGLLQ